MAVRINPGFQEQMIAHLFTQLEAEKQREQNGLHLSRSDICEWAETHFYIPNTGKPVKLPLHQKAIFRFFFTRAANGHFPFQNLVYSTVKKSGKSTSAGIVARWFAETQARYGEIYTIGNDLEQAKDRSYKEVVRSLELTPGYDLNKNVLPGRWNVQKLTMRCLLTGGTVKAIAVDAKGEAGGQPALTVWTELWGFENTDARRFWEEMTPIPTVPDSIRMVETYAGYDGESELLHTIYQAGIDGHQLTAGELASAVARPDLEGETWQDFVDCWHETRPNGELHGDPNVLIPIYTSDVALLGMYWDQGLVARRMPWQHMYQPMEYEGYEGICNHCRRPETEHDIGITADQYYSGQEAMGPPQAYQRLHLNLWVGAESAFVPMEIWDDCGNQHRIERLLDNEKTPQVVAADAAVTGDCCGIISVNRCPHDNDCVDIRALRKWDPRDSGGVIDLAEPEEFLVNIAGVNNVYQIAYDPFQFESSAQRIRKRVSVWVEGFNQVADRLKADSQLYDLIINKRVHYWHSDDCYVSVMKEQGQFVSGMYCNCWLASLREHIANANSKMQKDEDSKLRIVKKSGGKKIDLAVALSMATARCLYLRMEN